MLPQCQTVSFPLKAFFLFLRIGAGRDLCLLKG